MQSTYHKLVKELEDSSTTLVAVSKTKTVEDIRTIYDQGQRIFGENRVQELVEKEAKLPKDIEWHMIGQLQTNKVKFIAPFVSLIHSIGSIKLLKEVDKQAKRYDRSIPVLLQMKIAAEETKAGFDEVELTELCKAGLEDSYPNVEFVGMMGMATFTNDQEQIRNEFSQLSRVYTSLKKEFLPSFQILSMGMSGDYQLAIEEGSNMVRIGSLLFGSR